MHCSICISRGPTVAWRCERAICTASACQANCTQEALEETQLSSANVHLRATLCHYSKAFLAQKRLPLMPADQRDTME